MYEIFEKLCQEKGVTPYRVGKETGIQTATLSEWKKGKYTPKANKLQKIADYFGVSLEYLTTGEQPEHKSKEGAKYYFSDETAKMAQELFEKPGLRVLFDAARDVDASSLAAVASMIEEFKKTNPDG